MRVGAKHHSCRRGQYVRVVLRDGTTIYGDFLEHNRRYCLIKGRKGIPWSKVARFVPVRPQDNNEDSP